MKLKLQLLIFPLLSSQAMAQQIVQQPVVGVTSVNTTVSVPDRGSAYLGGSTSAQSGRVTYGPMRSGTSSGITRQATSISTSVYIHDFEEMDQALLNSPAGIAAQNRVRQNSAMRTLAEQDATTPTPLEKANRHSELALKAERSGKRTVARLHWEMAARNGSDLARQQLTDRYPESALANKSTPIRQAGASADPTSKSTVSLDR